jgi:hypothetical protein
MKQKDKEYVSELKEYLKKAEERVKYSLERFDILIISLSSGGLVLALNLFKNYSDSCYDKDTLNLSWTFFSIALIVNLLSQVTGYFANKYDIKVTKNIINKVEGKKTDGNNKKLQNYQDTADFFTKWLNIISFASLTTGIITLIIFTNSITK